MIIIKSISYMKFEDLASWKKARSLGSSIYGLTRLDELRKDYGLSSQIQRAGVSIMTNIAEGFERYLVKISKVFFNRLFSLI